MTTVALRRQTQCNALCKPNSQTIDFARVQAHLARLRCKHVVNQSTLTSPKVADLSLEKEQTLLARMRQYLVGTNDAKHRHPQHHTGKTGTVVLTDDSENLWHGPITLGGHTFEVDFDTGSTDLFINKSVYTPGATSKDTGKSFKAAFSDYTMAKGEIYEDTLEIGGIKADGVVFGWADSDFIDATKEDDKGIAGMAFKPASQIKQSSFFDVLMSANVLAKPVFTFALRDTRPTLTLGGMPDGLCAEPAYVDVDASRGFWETSAILNGAPVKATHDTGSALIVAPPAVARTLFAQLGLETHDGGGYLYAVLDPNAPLPKVTIQCGTFSCTLRKETLTSGTSEAGKPVLSVIGADLGRDAVVLGDPWLRNVVAVFSRENDPPQIGFVAQ